MGFRVAAFTLLLIAFVVDGRVLRSSLAKDELSARKARALQRSALGTFSLLQADHSQVKSHDYDYDDGSKNNKNGGLPALTAAAHLQQAPVQQDYDYGDGYEEEMGNGGAYDYEETSMVSDDNLEDDDYFTSEASTGVAAGLKDPKTAMGAHAMPMSHHLDKGGEENDSQLREEESNEVQKLKNKIEIHDQVSKSANALPLRLVEEEEMSFDDSMRTTGDGEEKDRSRETMGNGEMQSNNDLLVFSRESAVASTAQLGPAQRISNVELAVVAVCLLISSISYYACVRKRDIGPRYMSLASRNGRY